MGVIMGYSTLDSWHLSRLLCVFSIYLFWVSFVVNLNVGSLKYLSFFVDSQRVFQYIWFILRWSHVPWFFTPSSILSEIHWTRSRSSYFCIDIPNLQIFVAFINWLSLTVDAYLSFYQGFAQVNVPLVHYTNKALIDVGLMATLMHV